MEQPDETHDAMDTGPIPVPSSPMFPPSSPDPLADMGPMISQPAPVAIGPSRPIQTADFIPTESVLRKRTTASRGSTPEVPRQPPTLEHFEFTSQRLANLPKAQSAEEAIDMARRLVLQASLMSTGTEHKLLLDLLEVFRDYTENNRVNKHGLSVLASQVSSLETVSRTLGSKVKLLQKPTTPATPTNTQPRVPQSQAVPAAMSYAAVASKDQPKSADWSTITRKKTAEPSVKNKLSTRQLVLTRDASIPFDSLRLRNAFNEAFANRSVTRPVVASVTTSAKQNLVITTTPSFTAKYLLENQPIWESLTSFSSALLIESWHKVAVHNIPTTYTTNESLAVLKHEISTFNKGLNVVGNPYWLTKEDRRREQETGTVCIAFATEREAQQAIRNKLYLLGISARAEKLHSTPASTQCQRCQRFGHSEARCSSSYVCKICGAGHPTKMHKCNTCGAKGRTCIHTIPVCANCNQSHTADSQFCDFFPGSLPPRSGGSNLNDEWRRVC
jgi:hypothetical protein